MNKTKDCQCELTWHILSDNRGKHKDTSTTASGGEEIRSQGLEHTLEL